MKKKLYILEGRKRSRPDRYVPNKATHLIGIFTSPKKAQNWILEEGCSFYPPNQKWCKSYFYALLETTALDIPDISLTSFYDKLGKVIK